MSIQFERLMKGFEEYPNNLFLGEDLVGLPVNCTLNNAEFIIETENLLVEPFIPDTSMPFNIIIFTVEIMTLFFLLMFRINFNGDWLKHWLYK